MAVGFAKFSANGASAIPTSNNTTGFAKFSNTKTKQFSSNNKQVNVKDLDLGTVEGLTEFANQSGLGEQVANITDKRKNRASVLQRLIRGLGAFNPAEAILTAQDFGTKAGLSKYIEGLGKDFATAATGKNFEFERRSFADVVKRAGVNNAVAKFGLGFLGDVLLDPTTYFGGSIVKAVGKIGGAGTGLLGRGLQRFAPKTKALVDVAAEDLKKALGTAFVPAFGTQEGFRARVMESVTKLDKQKTELVFDNFKRLGSDTLSTQQQQELVTKLISGKKAQFNARQAGVEAGRQKALARKAAESSDPAVQRLIGEQIERSKQFATQAGLKDPYEVYFPYIRSDRVKQFLDGGRTMKVGSEGYKKQFKNILKQDEIITDPVEAFSRREWEIVKDATVRTEMDSIIGEFGKPAKAFKNPDDALREGFLPVKEKGLFGKNIGWLPQNEKRFIDNMISPEFTTVDMIGKATGFDAITALFKRSVTGLFAPFHVRNYVSGHIQNFEALGVAALDPRTISAGQRLAWLAVKKPKIGDEVIKLGNKELKVKEVLQPFLDRFETSSAYIADIGDATKEFPKATGKLLSKTSIKETVKTLGLGEAGVPFRIARGVGNFIETQQKATAYLTALKQGKSTKQALQLAEVAGFDYRALTPFESKVMRRVIPFYSFTRKNIELQLKTLKENPQRINSLARIFDNAKKAFGDDETKMTPGWIADTLNIDVGETPDGLQQYITGFGTPIEAFTDLLSGNALYTVMKQTNPIIKAPTQIAVGKDFFRERDLQLVYDAKEFDVAPQIVKDMLDIKEVTKPKFKFNAETNKWEGSGTQTRLVADPIKLSLARNLFTSRGFSYVHQVFDQDIEGFAKFLKLFTGIKTQEVDLAAQKFFKDKDAKEEIEALLLRHNELSQFSRSFIPDKTQ